MSSPADVPSPSGWVPHNLGGDDVGDNHHHTFVFPLTSENIPRETQSPVFTTFYAGNGLESDEEELPQRADHIPRPSNAFMLFRRHYCREHAREGPRPRRNDPQSHSPAPGSMSKNAGQAWHQLSKEKRAYWVELAIVEKEAHARKYPGYEFRPNRSASERRDKRPRSSARRGDRRSFSGIGRNASASSSQGTLRVDPSRSLNATPVPDSPIIPSSFLPSHEVQEIPAKRVLHRRSLSVPIFPNLPPVVNEETQFSDRALRRRSRSITTIGDGRSYFSAYEATSNNFTTFQGSVYALPAQPAHVGFPNGTYQVSPMAAVSSSLAGWNGELLGARPLSVTPQQANSPLSFSAPLSSEPLYNQLGQSDAYALYTPRISGNYGSMEAMGTDSVANALPQYDIGISGQIGAWTIPTPVYLPFGIYRQEDPDHAPQNFV